MAGFLSIALAVMLLLALVCLEPNSATRVLHDHEDQESETLVVKEKLGLQSLPRGTDPSSEASGCTYIPGTSSVPRHSSLHENPMASLEFS
ncbi:hypothetical protein FNV43_RR01506 [Rhamnella rubrinervis]|uniref:Uncharacterized protein n=1 Tax=Rhamnella rubrinervis TaxID=2594499 RepID=A0A8K0HPY6_9ROSA|nr:hypothetical protein FNV43_RR01506 [Rhamnella rubrinervis]